MILPTVKLTVEEWTALAIEASKTIPMDDIRTAFIAAFGEERGLGYFINHDGDAWTQRDTWAFVKAIAPHIPGDTEDIQIDWLMNHAAPCFATPARFAEVVAFVKDRVLSFKASGGSLDAYVETPGDPPPPVLEIVTGGDIPPGTIWLYPNVSAWPVTSTLKASVGGGQIRVDYDKAKVWPVSDGVNANPWVFVNKNGQWYAATFEYLRGGQMWKPMGVLDRSGGLGDHIKKAPLSSWTPSKGERIGLMVSGLCRGGLKNVQERTQVQFLNWP